MNCSRIFWHCARYICLDSLSHAFPFNIDIFLNPGERFSIGSRRYQRETSFTTRLPRQQLAWKSSATEQRRAINFLARFSHLSRARSGATRQNEFLISRSSRRRPHSAARRPINRRRARPEIPDSSSLIVFNFTSRPDITKRRLKNANSR